MADKRLESLMRTLFHIWTYTPQMSRLRSGHLLKEWLDAGRNKTEAPTKPLAMKVYSAHDANVASMMFTLGVFNETVCELMFFFQKYSDNVPFFFSSE